MRVVCLCLLDFTVFFLFPFFVGHVIPQRKLAARQLWFGHENKYAHRIRRLVWFCKASTGFGHNIMACFIAIGFVNFKCERNMNVPVYEAYLWQFCQLCIVHFSCSGAWQMHAIFCIRTVLHIVWCRLLGASQSVSGWNISLYVIRVVDWPQWTSSFQDYGNQCQQWEAGEERSKFPVTFFFVPRLKFQHRPKAVGDGSLVV